MLSQFLLFGLESEALFYACIGAGALAIVLVVLAIVVGVKTKKANAAAKQNRAEPELIEEMPAENPVSDGAEPVEPEGTPVQEQPVEPEEAEQPVEVTEITEPEKVAEQPVEVTETPEPKEVEEPTEEPDPVVTEEPAEQLEEVTEEQSAKPEEAEQPEEENDEPDNNDDKDEKEEDETVRTVSRINGHVRYIIIKYNKSFTAKIIQSSDEVKNYYSIIKNELLSYKGVKARMSWKGETFYSGRTTYAKLCVRGKCLGLFLALNAKDYGDSKYILDDMSEIATYEKTPCLYRIKNDRRVKYSAELIATVMGDREKLAEPEVIDWAKKNPYENTDALVERGLIKVLTEEDAQSGDVFAPRDYVAASEVDELMEDEVATALIEENEELSDRTKCDIINIDTLGKYFESGETVTLEEIKKRIESFPRRATYIKVLARGTLDKKLTVIADSFSMEAAKMILLTGGNVVKKKNF